MLDEAKSEFGNLIEVEPIKCEWNYINIRFRDEIDTSLVQDVHNVLYTEADNVVKGWPTLLVHDSFGKYIFSHEYNGRIHYQTGD